jgi:hypothetical protein
MYTTMLIISRLNKFADYLNRFGKDDDRARDMEATMRLTALEVERLHIEAAMYYRQCAVESENNTRHMIEIAELKKMVEQLKSEMP